jgi:hypothetical protein
VQRVDLSVDAAQLRELLACDPYAHAGRQLPQPPVDAVDHPRVVQRAALQGALKLGAQLEQMPAQPVHGPGPLGDEILAVIEQQADLHRPLVQVRDGELLDPVLDHRAGDRERVDLIGLARLALPLARGTHPLRCHPDDPLAGGQQRLLKAPGDVPDRPFVWLTPNEADLRRTTATQGESHASIKSRRWSSGGDGRHEH